MGIRVLAGAMEQVEAPSGAAVLFDSVTGTAFGPLFSSDDEANEFLGWYSTRRTARDLRRLNEMQVREYVSTFRRERQRGAA